MLKVVRKTILKLALSVPEFVIECESCGYELKIPKDQLHRMPEFVECSRCAAERWHIYTEQRLANQHRKPPNLPPMIKIDTKDMPGFVRDRTAKLVAEQLALFKK